MSKRIGENDLEYMILKTIRKYNLISENDKVIVGVSGGPDSIALLNSLYSLKEKLKIELIVCHVNHLIRQQAKDDERFVKEYCDRLGIRVYIKREDVTKLAKEEKKGLEEAGRDVRYEFFYDILKKENAQSIAIAHNMNDNSETVLMHLLRGTGISGLKGISPRRDEIIRPLIECNREQIEKYCEENMLEPRIDHTNQDNTYTRNRIRNELIPYIQDKFNPNIIENLNTLSSIVSEEESYWEEEIEEEYKIVLVEESENCDQIILDLKKFNSKQRVIKTRLIRYTVNRLLGNCAKSEKTHIDDIIKLCENNVGNKYLTPNKSYKVHIKNGKVFYMTKG